MARENIRAGTGRLLTQVLLRRKVVDDPSRGCDVIEPASAWTCQGHFHRTFIDGTHLLDMTHLLFEHLGCVLTVPRTFEGCDDRSCIDWLPRSEGGVGLQLESVGTTVRTNTPRTGQKGFDLALLIDTHQCLVDVVQQHKRGTCSRISGWIHACGLGSCPNIEDDGSRPCPTGSAAGHQCQAESQQHDQQSHQRAKRPVGSHVYVLSRDGRR